MTDEDEESVTNALKVQKHQTKDFRTDRNIKLKTKTDTEINLKTTQPGEIYKTKYCKTDRKIKIRAKTDKIYIHNINPQKKTHTNIKLTPKPTDVSNV